MGLGAFLTTWQDSEPDCLDSSEIEGENTKEYYVAWWADN